MRKGDTSRDYISLEWCQGAKVKVQKSDPVSLQTFSLAPWHPSGAS